VSGVLYGKTIKSISSGNFSTHTCATDLNDSVYCWGYNIYGQLGDGANNDALVPVAVSTSGVLSGKSVSSFSLGMYSSYALASDGRIYSWGHNNSGELGNGTVCNNSFLPSAISFVAQGDCGSGGGSYVTASWKGLSYGHGLYSTCGINMSDSLYCWGGNDYGQNGNFSRDNAYSPVAVYVSGVLSGKTIKQVSVGSRHVCAVASDDKAYCWGQGSYGQLGNNYARDSSTPVAVDTSGVLAGKTIKQVAAGVWQTCAIASDDKAYCWGRGIYGILGNGTGSDSLVPVAVSTAGVLSGKTVKQISSGDTMTCAIASDNKAYCWGGNVGNGDGGEYFSPVAVSTSGVLSGKTIKQISAGDSHACVIASDDKAYCWGYRGSGAVGDGSTSDYVYSPVAVDTSGVLSGKTINQIAAGYSHTCVIASDNRAYCWGGNFYGGLGNGLTEGSSVPVVADNTNVLAGKNLTQVAIATYSSCVLDSNGQAHCWGSNWSGELGYNNFNQSILPVDVVILQL
jgi:alpha-tubulin suppressor-like RCC1 family protein